MALRCVISGTVLQDSQVSCPKLCGVVYVRSGGFDESGCSGRLHVHLSVAIECVEGISSC